MVSPRQTMTAKSAQDEQGAQQAQLLGDDREDEVGVGRRDDVLLGALAEAGPEQAARPDGHDRLVDLVGGPLQVLVLGEVLQDADETVSGDER